MAVEISEMDELVYCRVKDPNVVSWLGLKNMQLLLRRFKQKFYYNMVIVLLPIWVTFVIARHYKRTYTRMGILKAVPWFRWLVAGSASHRGGPGSYPVSPCGICGAKSGTGTRFLRLLRLSPVSIIPPWLSMLIYILGDKQ
jgi:hypothetical protein